MSRKSKTKFSIKGTTRATLAEYIQIKWERFLNNHYPPRMRKRIRVLQNIIDHELDHLSAIRNDLDNSCRDFIKKENVRLQSLADENLQENIKWKGLVFFFMKTAMKIIDESKQNEEGGAE
jgi:hypothetical protein